MKHIQNDRIVEILWKYRKGKALTAGEKEILGVWLSDSTQNQETFRDITNEELMNSEIKLLLKHDETAIWSKIASRIEVDRPVLERVQEVRRPWSRYAAAAFILFMICVGTYLWVNNFKDGSLVNRSSRLSYADQTPLTFNTLSTPVGEQKQVVLPDGTKVWLNSTSTLRYPTSFTSKKRIVQLSGEAYFEVNPSASSTFCVKVNDVDIEVLGTSFNVMAYKDESHIKTTLVEGSVKVTQGDDLCILKPGQQAEVANTEVFPIRPVRKIRVTDNSNTDEAIAWKNGYFYFKSLNIDNIMRQLCRWYDVEVVYPSGKPSGTYSGIINRNSNISEVLNVLSLNGIRTKLQGKKVQVLQ